MVFSPNQDEYVGNFQSGKFKSGSITSTTMFGKKETVFMMDGVEVDPETLEYSKGMRKYLKNVKRQKKKGEKNPQGITSSYFFLFLRFLTIHLST